MNGMRRLGLAGVLAALTLTGLSGCGKQADSAKSGGQTADSGSGDPLVSASITGPDGTQKAPLEKGTPEWMLAEIRNMRAATVDTTLSAADAEKARREQQTAIVEMATEMISITHADPAKEALFTEAAKQLMESRMELALVDPNAIDDLYQDRDQLYERNPESKAANEAAFVVARFAHTKARDFAKQEPRWLDEFSHQARAFASSFPNDAARAVPLVYAAGLSCELNGKVDEALACYTLLRDKFPTSPQGQQIVAVLRRLQMVGKPVQLAGPTIDGKYLSIDKFAGKAVLVVFWSSENSHFRLMLPKLLETTSRYEKQGLSVIGVNLDQDQQAADAFIQAHELNWPQIFDSDPAKRRWNNKIVTYYGIRNIPLMWLIDQHGTIVDIQVDLAKLDGQVRSLLGKREAGEQ